MTQSKMKTYELKTSGGLTSAIATCSDCGKEFDSKNSGGLAAIHAKKYGHEVRGEVVICFHYKPIKA